MSSTLSISANGLSVSGVGNARLFTSYLTAGSVLANGSQIRVGTFANTSSLSTIIANYDNNKGTTYASIADLSTALNSIFTAYGENGGNLGSGSSSTVNKITINDKANLTTVLGALSMNIVNFDPVASLQAGKQVYLWATDSSSWSSATALALVTDTSWIVPSSTASNLTVNTAYIDLASTSELLIGLSGPSVSAVNSIQLIPEPSVGSLILLSASCWILAKRANSRRSLHTEIGG